MPTSAIKSKKILWTGWLKNKGKDEKNFFELKDSCLNPLQKKGLAAIIFKLFKTSSFLFNKVKTSPLANKNKEERVKKVIIFTKKHSR
jgi:hypothetical protein